MRGPHDAGRGIERGTRGVLRIIRPNHQCTAVSSRTGPVAWCDHENSTVKFLRALHSALRARNRTGDKNRTGPVVECDWGVSHGHGIDTISKFLFHLWGNPPVSGRMLTFDVPSRKSSWTNSFPFSLSLSLYTHTDIKQSWSILKNLLCDEYVGVFDHVNA